MTLKKILSLLVAVTMLFSCVGITAMAEESYVAKIGDTEYATLREAIQAAESGENKTIELITDAVMENTSGDYDGENITGLTINGNGKTVTVAPECGNTSEHSSTFSGTDFYVYDMTLDLSDETLKRVYGFNMGKGSKIERVTIKEGEYNVILPGGTDAQMIDCTFIKSDVNSNAIYGDETPTTATIEGCTFNAARGAMLYGAVTFKNNTVNSYNGGSKGITLTNGASTVTGNIFNARINLYDSNATVENNQLLGEVEVNVAEGDTVDLSGNYWGGEAPAEITGAVVNSYYTTVNDDGTLDGEVSIGGEETSAAVKIGEVGYATLAEALTAASAMTGDVTVEIYDKVTLAQSFSGSYDSIKFVGKDTDAEIYLEVQGYITASGENVAFEDLILSKSEGGYITNAGFMNVAFGVYQADTVSYTDCTFTNGAYASKGTNTFTNCTFYGSHDKYSLWAYGDADIVVDECTFADYRGIKMYAEGAAKTTVLTVKNTSFSAVTDKPAIVLTYGESVTLEGNTYSSTGVFELDLDGAPNGTAVTADITDIACMNDKYADCGVLVDGKIYTTITDAAAVATSGSTVTLMYDVTETVELAEGVTLNKNGYTADGVTVKAPDTKVNTGYISASYTSGVSAVFGEATNVVATKSFIVELYSDETLVGTATLNDPEKKLLDGQKRSITWHAALTNDGDGWWSTQWVNDALNVNDIPNKAKLYVDGVLVDEDEVQLNINDLEKPVFAAVTDAEGNVLSFVAGTGYLNVSSGDNAPKYDDALKATLENGDNIVMLRDVALTGDIKITGKSFTLDGNGHSITNGGLWLESGTYDVKNVVFDSINVTTAGQYGVLEFTYAKANVTGCTFINNNAENCIAVDTNAGGNGDSVVTIDDCTFSGNTCSTAVINSADGATNVKNSAITGNTASIAVIYNSANCSVIGNVFSKNTLNGTNENKATILSGPYAAGEYEVSINKNAFLDDAYTAVYVEDWTEKHGASSTNDLSGNYWIDGDVPVAGTDYVAENSEAVTLDSYYSTYNEDGSLDNLVSLKVAMVGEQEFGSVLAALQYAIDHSAAEIKILADSREVMPTDFELVINADLTITADSPVNVEFYNNGTSYDFVVGSNNNNKLTIGANVHFDLVDRIIWIGYYDNDVDVQVDGYLGASQIWHGADTKVSETGTLDSHGEALVMRRGALLTVDGGKVDANYFNILAGQIMAENGAEINSGAFWINNTGNYADEGTVNINIWNSTLNCTGNIKTESDDEVYIDFYNSTVDIKLNDGVQSQIGELTTIEVNGENAILNIKDVTNNGTILVYGGGELNVDGTLTNLGAGTTFTDATVKIEKLDNDAELFIDGTSTIQVEDGTGSTWAIRVKDGTVLNNSYVKAADNFTIRLLGNATFNGGFESAYLQGASTSSGGIGGTVTIEDGTVIDASYGVDFSNEYTLNGGTIKLSGGNVDGDIWGFIFQNGTFEINSDIIAEGNGEAYTVSFTNATATVNGNISHSKSGGEPIYVKSGSDVTFGNDAVITTDCSVYVEGTLKSSGDVYGEITKVTDNAVIEITGGTYDHNPEAYVAEGYISVAQSNGTYLVGMLPNADVSNLGAITVTSNEGDYTYGSSYYVYDLIGGTGLSSATEPFDMSLAMQFVAKDSPEEATANAFGQYTTDFFIKIDGIENGSFVGNGCYLAGYYPSFGAWVKIPLDGFTIDDGKIYPVITSAGFDFNYVDICTSVEKFICGIYLTDDVLRDNPNISVNLTLGLSENVETAQSASFVTVDDYTYTAEDLKKKAASITDAEDVVTEYATLKEAIAAANDGDTVTLLMDIVVEEQIEIKESITLDLNEKTISSSGAIYRPIKITGNNTDITVKVTNGTITVSDVTTKPEQSAALLVYDGADVTLEDVTINGSNYGVMLAGYDQYSNGVANNNVTSLYVNSGTAITAESSAIIAQGAYPNTYIEINDGAAVTSNDSVAIYYPHKGELIVNGGTITGDTGICIKAGSLTVSGGTITAIGAGKEHEFVSSGAVSTGDAIVVESLNYGYYGAPTVSITGGTITSAKGKAVVSYAEEGYEVVTDFITGGTFSSDVTELCAEGFTAVQNEDGTYGIEEVELFGFYGMNLDLESSMKANFYILSSYFEGEDYYAKIVHSSATGDIETIVDFADWKNNGSYKQITYTELAAKNMADTVTVTIYDGNDKKVSVDYVRSIKTYAEDYIKAMAGTGDKWVTPFVDMLNYGAAAQEYFSYNTENLANADIEKYQSYATQSDVGLSADLETSPENIYGANLDLENRIVYNGYFSNVTDGMTAKVSYTDHLDNVVEYSAALVKNGSYHQVSVDSLVIADAKQLVTITVYDANNNVHAFRKESINGYLYRAIQGIPAFESLGKAMAKFTASAYTALHTK